MTYKKIALLLTIVVCMITFLMMIEVISPNYYFITGSFLFAAFVFYRVIFSKKETQKG